MIPLLRFGVWLLVLLLLFCLNNHFVSWDSAFWEKDSCFSATLWPGHTALLFGCSVSIQPSALGGKHLNATLCCCVEHACEERWRCGLRRKQNSGVDASREGLHRQEAGHPGRGAEGLRIPQGLRSRLHVTAGWKEKLCTEDIRNFWDVTSRSVRGARGLSR